jgi:hypothetical protein
VEYHWVYQQEVINPQRAIQRDDDYAIHRWALAKPVEIEAVGFHNFLAAMTYSRSSEEFPAGGYGGMINGDAICFQQFARHFLHG